MTAQPVLEARGVSKAFFGITAVDNVSIHVQPGEILGLIGQNGAGKSTLMNIIGGVVIPDSGTMTVHGKPYAPRTPAEAHDSKIAFIHQELNLFTNLSIAENILIDEFPARRLGFLHLVNWGEVRSRAQKALELVGLHLSPDMKIDRISPGERQLVEIARALYLDASLIILDEPTTSLTVRETEILFALLRRLREEGKAMIYISHILNDVLALADRIAVMRDGQLVGQGNVDEFNVGRMISMMVGRNLDNLYPPRTTTPTEVPLLELENVSARGIVDAINFTVHRNEVVGLFGLMGSGRTELARMIYGLDPLEEGAVVINGKRVQKRSARGSIQEGIAFVTENRREEGLLMNVAIADNIALVALPEFARTPLQVVNQEHMNASAQSAAVALQLKSANIQTQSAKALSGGNQQKVVIAKWLLSEPRVFIMDEPTRGIDVGAKYEIYSIIDQLAAGGSGVLFISSELEELMGMCDRILVMSRGEIFGEFYRDQFEAEAILRAAFREGAIHESA
ncbi:sugar ABC transporter ATP-binding protein [Geitlerinema splendidum]|jgi:ABC-type sugar transport system ATPase subunit|nr:sugar ABC transporter ATP-binding protein [Geitlerinema splendidum]